DSGDEREAQAGLTGLLPLMLGQFARQNRDENDVVDAKDNLKQRERDQRNPAFGRCNPFHGAGLSESVSVSQRQWAAAMIELVGRAVLSAPNATTINRRATSSAPVSRLATQRNISI